MKVFHCDHCDQLLFFENVNCVRCGRALAYVPEVGLTSLDPAGRHRWTSPVAPGTVFRLCANYSQHNVCNWAIPVSDGSGKRDETDALCRACQLTRTIPNLSREGNIQLWYKLEAAKRRLVYTLDQVGLPYQSKHEDPRAGLAFEFLEDTTKEPDGGGGCVITGHRDGVITINVAEANDAERVKRRTELGEPYRTLLGHFRHEVGHYYWDRLIRDDPPRLEAFRARFGDERADYQAALKRHYEQGAAPNWEQRYVSAYATMHPWEDWAETWAHYLHMSDALETAAACGISLTPSRRDEPTMKKVPNPIDEGLSFERMITSWSAVTYALNNLNRGMGHDDAYPFVLAGEAVDKLLFVHQTVIAAT